MLARLAAEHATGALLRDHGTLYLTDGQVVHAEAPAAPGLDVLLTRRLPREGWQEAFDRAGAAGRVGRFLVDSGRLADGELELAHLGALFDAAYFALAPGSGPTRFRHGVAHWMGPVRPVSAHVVARECLRRRELLDALWPHPQIDNFPVERASSDTPIPRRQRDVLDLADGLRTPVDIARLLGRPAFHTLIDVRRLAAAGAVRTPRDTPPPPPAVPQWVARMSEDPDVALLRRLRDALEAL
ncbi:transcriptional regulator [Streptomyces sp. NBC_00237]|uniref:transcriptional regulator n=1 Tax=Streptomyces sp. NBC_00237 TaxID=2975687 RepID=UPI002253B64D|nr:transcriptional regulator [Streptomyces sp. NBC_00237]MCX5200784.1 transcriptional regulator [Streptomyces sp. NBC_00237]